MHEISIVQGLFVQLEELAKDNGASRIISVTVEIGPLSGVVVDSFQFGFDILAAEHPMLKEAKLILRIPPVRYTCTSCGKVFEDVSRPGQCAQCVELLLVPQGGDDVILNQVEME